MSAVEVFALLIPAIFASQGFWSYVLYKVKRRDKSYDLRRRADLVILHDLVYKYCQAAILREYTTFNEFDNVTELYQVYSELGGNGTGEKLYKEFCNLPKHSGYLTEESPR